SHFYTVPPRYESKFISVNAVKGELCILRCLSYGDQPMTFTWQKYKQLLDLATLDKRISFHSLGTNSTQWIDASGTELRIQRAARHDSALYSCEARNDFGVDDTNIQLIVQGKADLISLPLRNDIQCI